MADKHPIVREIQQEILKAARESGDPKKLDFIRQYMDGKLEFNDAIAAIESIDMASSQQQARTFATPKHADNFTRLQRDWVDAQLILAGVMQPDRSRDLGECFDMSMSRFGEICIKQNDAGLIKRAAANGVGVEDVLFQQTRDWAEGPANQTTAAFPNAVEDLFKKSGSLGYSSADEPLTFLPNDRYVSDFKVHSMVQSVDAPPLQKVTENNGFQVAAAGDYAETGQLETAGIIYSITRQSIVNNDTSSIAMNAAKAGKSAKASEADDIAALLQGSYVLADGFELFDAVNHSNLEAAGSTPDVAGLDAVRMAMSQHTGPSGTVLELSPAVMIVPRSLEGTGATLLNSQVSAGFQQLAFSPGYFPGSYSLIASGRLTGSNWYMMCGKQFSAIERLLLANSSGEPTIEFFTQFQYDGVQARIRHDYDMAVADYRTLYKIAVA